MHGAISPLLNAPSWCGIQLKAQGQIYILYYIIYTIVGGIRDDKPYSDCNINTVDCISEYYKCISKQNNNTLMIITKVMF
jgi:hypothetical protein